MSVSDVANLVRVRIETSAYSEHDKFSGVGQYVYRLAEEFSKRPDCDTEFFCGPFYRSKQLLKKPSPIQTLLDKSYRKLVSCNLALPCDLLSPADLTIFANFASLPTSRSKVTAAVIHDLAYLDYPQMIESKNLKHLRRVVPMAVKHCDFIITGSETSRQSLIEHFAIDPARCLATPIPPSADFFVADQLSDEVRAKYGIPDKPYLLFLGNIEPRKNLSLLISAYQQLDSSLRQKYPLVVAGAVGWKASAVGRAIESARSHGVDIIVPGFIDESDKPSLYRSARLFIFPSLYEGFGIPVVEAMAAETPVILSDIPVMREVGKDFARYTDPTDSRSLASAITEALAEPTADLVPARDYVKSISWSKNAENILDLYRQIA